MTDDLHKLMEEGFKLGLYDRLIAQRLSISSKQVYGYRRSLNISGKDLQENRLNAWMSMIRSGYSLDLVALIYEIKPQSVRIELWRKKQFSFREARKNLRDSYQNLQAEGSGNLPVPSIMQLLGR